MTVKEIIKSACALVGREDVVKYLNDNSVTVGEDTLPTLNVMVSLLNIVIGELSGTFIPMIKLERVSAKNKRVYYADLLERCLKVIAVYDDSGNKINYAHTPEYMDVFADNVQVEYQFIPPNYDLESEIGYTDADISASALAFGLCAEYSISKGSFDQAVMWHERYVDAVSAKRKLKNGTVKQRSFV